MTRLYRCAQRLGLDAGLKPAFEALARGQSATTTAELAKFDQALAGTHSAEQGQRLVLHARGNVLALSEVLTQYATFFDAGVSE
jgi:hypothetical protein